MRKPKYVVNLSEQEKKQLQDMQVKGKFNVREVRRAKVLLMANERKQNKEIVEHTGMTEQSVINIKKRFCAEGLQLKEKPRPGQKPKIDKRAEQYLIATACSPAPEGRDVWTMQMLADKLVEMKLVDSISDEAVRLRLKKVNLNPGSKNNGV